MRIVMAGLTAACLCATPVLAAGATGPLAPGNPAGVQKAQMSDNTILYILGGGAIIAGIVLIATNNGGNHNTSTGSSSSSSSSP